MLTNRLEETEEESWISVSDLMSGLMMVFLLIAIIYAKTNQKQVIEWVNVEEEIYQALVSEFKDDLTDWQAEIERETLTIRFMSPEMLFARGSDDLRDSFKHILNDFFPRYVQLLVSRFSEQIAEVRIEGHTSSEFGALPSDKAFLKNMELSQDRTISVLKYSFGLREVTPHNKWMQEHITALGLSSARLVLKGGEENRTKSRRVEFAIRTNTKDVLMRLHGTN